MDTFKIDLEPPAYLTLVVNGTEIKLDPYEASRKISDIARLNPAAEGQWNAVRGLLAKYLSVPVEDVAENQARQFEAAVDAFVGKLDEQQKKTSERIASWLPCTPESPATTEAGPSGASEPGSATPGT